MKSWGDEEHRTTNELALTYLVAVILLLHGSSWHERGTPVQQTSRPNLLL